MVRLICITERFSPFQAYWAIPEGMENGQAQERVDQILRQSDPQSPNRSEEFAEAMEAAGFTRPLIVTALEQW